MRDAEAALRSNLHTVKCTNSKTQLLFSTHADQSCNMLYTTIVDVIMCTFSFCSYPPPSPPSVGKHAHVPSAICTPSPNNEHDYELCHGSHYVSYLFHEQIQKMCRN